MDSKPTKQAVTLALDIMASKGRFSVRDVAEKAYLEGVRFEKLSLSDQRDVMIEFLMREAKSQMKAPLRSDLKEEYFRRLPDRYWPILEKLSKTICVSQGGNNYHVFTLYATEDDWTAFLEMVDVMTRRAKTAKNSGRNIRDLLKAEGVSTLYELMTGQRAHITALPNKASLSHT